ncbi:uncharacterized protein LOC132721076 [Ruditapes philippinarum]|uniref:uncharacterized protein LOC132721076 n=1 Tax=Ruditapes philippinarum TaxID=129788 RepID=UPI00295BBF85|nr:uncharacterized protein LOC132721076 [Ruditapes philippinarum]
MTSLTVVVTLMVVLTISGSPQGVQGSLENLNRRAPGASIKPNRFAPLQRKYLGAHTDHSKNLVGRALSKASHDIHLKDQEIDFGEANPFLNREARARKKAARKKVARRYEETDFNPANNLLNREARDGRALSKASRDIHLKDHEIDFGEANPFLNSEARGNERLAKKKVASRFLETDFNPANNLLNREARAGPEKKNRKKGLY